VSTSLAAVVGGTIVGIVLILRALRPGRKRRFRISIEFDSDDHDNQADVPD
jgi:hypothetical protein